MKRISIKILSCILVICMMISYLPIYSVSASSSTNIGLCEHVYTAFYEDWQYCYGGTSYGYVDCSGLIWTYNGVGGNRVSLMSASPETGYISNGIPNIHGLGLYQPGHVGVYVGGGMAIDARDEYSDMCYQSVYSKNWTNWFKIYGVSYPTNGWVSLQGNSYFYENGEYIVNTSRTIDGVTYNFDASGKSDKTPDDLDYNSADYSKPSNNDSSNNSSSSSSSTENSYQENNSSSSSSTSSSSSSSQSSNSSSSSSSETSNDEEQEEEICLYVGMIGKDVKKLQKRLKELKYFNDDLTDFFGAVTESAVKVFQDQNDLDVTGIVDETTYKKLFSKSASKAKFIELSVGDYSDSIVEVQQKLYELEYFYDEITGYYGDITEIAVSQFQAVNDIKTSGIVDESTYKKLFSDDAKENPNAGTLIFGMKGDSIKAMQERLFDLRYYKIEPTSEYDEATAEAVKSFLLNNNITGSEEMNVDNLQILYSSEAKKSKDYDLLQKGYSGDDVKDLQIKLKAVECFDGVCDGVFGEKTEEAVKLAQKKLGLPESGIASSDFADKLSVLLIKVNTVSAEKAGLTTAKLANEALAGAVNDLSLQNNERTVNVSYVIVLTVIASMLLITAVGIFMFSNKKFVEEDED